MAGRSGLAVAILGKVVRGVRNLSPRICPFDHVPGADRGLSRAGFLFPHCSSISMDVVHSSKHDMPCRSRTPRKTSQRGCVRMGDGASRNGKICHFSSGKRRARANADRTVLSGTGNLRGTQAQGPWDLTRTAKSGRTKAQIPGCPQLSGDS